MEPIVHYGEFLLQRDCRSWELYRLVKFILTNTTTINSVSRKYISNNSKCRKSFTSSATNPPVADSLYFSAMTAVFNYQDLQFPLSTNQIVVRCDNKTVINQFISHMQFNSPFSVSCGGHIWRIISCSYGPIFCVDCGRVCDVCPGSIAPNILNQAGYFGNGGGYYMISSCKDNCYIHHGASYGILNILSSRMPMFPLIVQSKVYSDINKTTVSVTLSKAGTVICGGMISGNMPQSVFDIIKNQPYNLYETTLSVNVDVVITNLIESTSYDIYCYTEDFM